MSLLLKKPSLSKDDPANYRPITNLCAFSKILEQLALKRLQPHVLESGNYSRFQSAYRPGYSTETALLKIVNDIRTVAGEGRCSGALPYWRSIYLLLLMPSTIHSFASGFSTLSA